MSFSEYAKRVRARSEGNSENTSGLLERSRKNRAKRVIDQANAYQNRIEQYSQGNGTLDDLDTSAYRTELEKVSDYLDRDTKKNILALYDLGDKEIQRVK